MAVGHAQRSREERAATAGRVHPSRSLRYWARRGGDGALWRLVTVALCVGSLAPVFGAVNAQASSSCPNAALRTGASDGLPDCRAYEQVSPVDKGGDEAVLPGLSVPAQASPNGERVAFESYNSFPGASGSTLYSDHLSARGSSGWQTTELTPTKTEAGPSASYNLAYDAFSEDLSLAVFNVPEQLLTPDATPYVQNLFLRHSNGSYSLINSAHPSALELPPPECENCYEEVGLIGYAGASRDFSHLIFESNSKLTPEAPEQLEEREEFNPGLTYFVGLTQNLYESAGSQVRLVGILPDGTPAAGGAMAGAGSIDHMTTVEDQRIEHAISETGSRIVFQAASDEGTSAEAGQGGLTEVYDRIEGGETIELSAPAPASSPKNATAEPSRFWAASADGSRVFFTSSAELTTRSNTGTANDGETLYEYDLTSQTLTDLTVDANAADSATGARVLGVVGASTDGTYVYFVAEGQLAQGQGVDGQPNLYVVHDRGAPHFIATLSSADSRDWSAYSAELEAYVTPDGGHLAFMSRASLAAANFSSGYDNADRTSGEPDSEVYEYSAPSSSAEARGAAGEIVCGSCDPSGARPAGGAFIAGVASEGSASTGLYHVRSLSQDGGRLFFTSPPVTGEDSPQVGAETPYTKVYEYERDGEGGCVNEHGCVYLITSPTNSADDFFLDASATGEDVFFATLSQLVPGDRDHYRDVYDARVDGGLTPAQGEAECPSGCRASGSPPPSAPLLLSGFGGPSGNLLPPAGVVKPLSRSKLKPSTKAQLLAKALKACRRDSNRKTRAACVKRAEKRHGRHANVKTTAKTLRAATADATPNRRSK